MGGKEKGNAVEIYDSLANGSTARKLIKYISSGNAIKSSYASTPDLFNVRVMELLVASLPLHLA